MAFAIFTQCLKCTLKYDMLALAAVLSYDEISHFKAEIKGGNKESEPEITFLFFARNNAVLDHLFPTIQVLFYDGGPWALEALNSVSMQLWLLAIHAGPHKVACNCGANKTS